MCHLGPHTPKLQNQLTHLGFGCHHRSKRALGAITGDVAGQPGTNVGGGSWPCNKCAETPHLSIPLSFQSPLPLRIHLLWRGRGGHCGGDEVGGYRRSPAIGGDWTYIGWRGVEGLGGHLNLAKTVVAAVEDGGEIATAW